MIAKIAVSAANFAIDKPYSYRIPEEITVKPGQRVQLPFGRSNKRTEGVVLAVESGDESKLKPIDGCLDEEPILTEKQLRLAAFLREQPFQPNDIFRELYSESFEEKKRKAQFILRTQFTENNVAYIYTEKKDLEELGLDTFTASRGMVNVMADLKGVGIWVNFTEADEGIVCELRSADLNVNPVAVKYGGGGHAKACGATVPDRETAMAMLKDLDKMMGEAK